MRRQSPSWVRQLHGAVELDALGLHAARREMPARDLRICGGDAHAAPARGLVLLRDLPRRRDHEPAMADLEIERRVDLRVFEFHQHVVAGDAQMRRAESDEGRHVEIAHAHDVEVPVVGLEAQLARVLVIELGLDLDARAPHESHDLTEDAALGQRQNQRLIRAIGLHRYPVRPSTRSLRDRLQDEVDL